MSTPESRLPDPTHPAKAFAEARAIAHAAAAAGFDWHDLPGPLAKVLEEAEEVREAWQRLQEPLPDAGRQALQEALVGELGDLLFAALNVCRLAGVDPGVALHSCNVRFVQRFRAMEAAGLPAASRGESVAHWDRLWQEAKQKGA